MLRLILAAVLALALAVPAAAQSQAANGSIEGTVADTSGGVLPGVTVTLTNTQTGAQRTVVSNEAGMFRAPLLPLGTYKVVAELQGFKKYEESGISLSVGQTVVLKIAMGVGSLNVDERRFTRRGSEYQSEDFATAANRVEIEISGGVGSVDVR